MSTSSHIARSSWRRRAVGLFIAGVLLASAGCSGGPADGNKIENSTLISYAGGASRLSGLEPTEAEEQLRDWARIGLASHLDLDTAQVRDATYDTLPVRDSAFAELTRQPTGPGRALFDGRGVLHVLVPLGDPHESRTIGLLIDQHRTDAGTDPEQVQVHHYLLHPDAQTIELTPEEPAPTTDVRAAHGFVAMRVDEVKGLTDFLSRTRHLSWLEVRGSEVWAGGWNWPDVPAAPLDVEDISVIQRGYLAPDSGRTPAFSLDPGPVKTRDDILAVLPGLRPELADRLISKNWAGSRFRSADGLTEAVQGALHFNNPPPAALAEMGLPTDATQLWALDSLLAGRPAYSQARNDGRLEGTKVGMTLFYTDKVAKDWVAGVGTGVPATAVGGFIADPEAVIPWSHCGGTDVAELSEYGRLWFGQNEAGFSFAGDRVNIGPQASRLFSRTEENGGTEVEPSFSFGRGLRWWDQHYQAVADYEPQYQRLDQIMRWSGALEWLVSNTHKLPELDDAAIRSDLRFKDWYAQHNELRERSPIEFVTPPSATHEAVLAKPSGAFKSCGFSWITGGVSLGDLTRRKGARSFHADLPESNLRAGLVDETSRFDPATGSGQIRQVSIDARGHEVDSLRRTFAMSPDGRAVVDVAADGRRVVSLRNLKAWLGDTAPRKLKVEIAADRGQISERVEFQDRELGQQEVRKYARPGLDTVTFQWKRGPLDRMLRALGSIEERLTAQPAAGVPSARDGVLYSYQDGSGRTLYRTGGPDEPWFSITNELTPPGEELAFRLGAPAPRTGKPQFFLAKSSPRPELPPGAGGPPQWMEVFPAAGDHSARVHLVGVLGHDAHPVPVTTPEGKTATLYQMGDRAGARLDDPILGFNGTAEGAALLRDFPRVAQAMREAAEAKDGVLRGVSLDGDGVALADADGVRLAAADHPWADRVQQAIVFDPSRQVPLFRDEGGRLFHLDPSPLTVAPGSARRTTLGQAQDTAGGDLYLHRSMLVVDKGVINADALPRDTRVTVRRAVVADRPSAALTATQPDIRTHGNAEWWRVSPIGAGSGSTATPSSTPNPPVPIGGVPVAVGQILLVCPDSGDKLPGCEE